MSAEFISYAQNFEDVMLWRALSAVEAGFYMDIGAQDPLVDSVSYAFYMRGWRGVHVEPTQQYADALSKARPDEVVEQVALSDQPGRMTFYVFSDTGLSTGDAEVAARHRSAGFPVLESSVATMTLDDLFARHGGRDIHWMKIDVEGLEYKVIAGWREKKNKPWILVIESTRPLSMEESFHEWEPLVLAKGYTFAYFDGLNRFYVDSKRPELLAALRVPPNVFDGFALNGTASNYLTSKVNEALRNREKEVQALATRGDELRDKTRELEERCVDAESRARNAEHRAGSSEARAHEAELRAKIGEARVAGAESRANEAEARARLAENRAVVAESKATHGEERASEAELRTSQALERATQADGRAADAELRAREAESRSAQAEARATRAEERASDAEIRAREAELRASRAERRLVAAERRSGIADARAGLAESRVAQAQLESSRAIERVNVVEQEYLQLQRSQAALLNRADELLRWGQALEEDLRSSRASNEALERLAEIRGQHLSAIYGSITWRLCAPIRYVKEGGRRAVRSARDHGKRLAYLAIDTAPSAVGMIGSWTLRFPALAQTLKRKLAAHPTLYQRLSVIVRGRAALPAPRELRNRDARPSGRPAVKERAKLVLDDLVRVRDDARSRDRV